MKLKQLPEDFIVEEINPLSIVSNGWFKVYVLEKKGVEALHALRHIAKESRVPFNALGYSGLKDKHALTRQYLTIPKKYDLKILDEPNLKIKYLGYTDKNVTLGSFLENKFTITVRAIPKGELDGIKLKAENVTVPNYYDSQRFGSVINNEFISKYALKGEFEKAVKLFLTGITKSDNRLIREEKKKILSFWPHFENLKTEIRQFSKVLTEYVNSKDWKKTYEAIPSETRNLFSNAFTSYLWNECVKLLLKKYVKKKYLVTKEYDAGTLIFYKKGISKLPETFKISNDEISKKILSLNNVTLDELNDFNLRERKTILVPNNFCITKPERDELNSKGTHTRYKITVTFSLVPGSYATLILKRIF